MIYGPVGSLKRPRSETSYTRFEVDGIALWVHGEVLEEADEQRRVRFHFGLLGWCRVDLGAA